MAIIALVEDNIGLSGKADVRPMAFKAGAAVSPGMAVCFDAGLSDSLVYPCDTDDADRQGFLGIALDDVATGQFTRVIMPSDGIVTGYTLTPASVAAHRPGKFVYTGATAGRLYTEDDKGVSGAIPVGMVVPMGSSVTKLGIMPIYSEASTFASQVTVTAADPTTDDDITAGYRAGDVWINSSDAGVFILISNAEGAADWDELAKV